MDVTIHRATKVELERKKFNDPRFSLIRLYIHNEYSGRPVEINIHSDEKLEIKKR